MAEADAGTGQAVTQPSDQPARAGLVLVALIAVAAVANLNLSVANVALPSIGRAFDSSQTALDLIAVGYSLGLAASVLYLGAIGDRYGRKLMLILGMVLSVPACLLAAFAPSDGVLFVARFIGGVSAGMAYPTTLALIAALWSGSGRTKSIALWSAIGGGIAALGPLVAGTLLEQFWWGSVFLITLPLVAVALVLAVIFVPAHVNETSEPVDNIGGVLSIVLVGSLILAINFAPVPNRGRARPRPGGGRGRRPGRLRPPATPGQGSAVRPSRRPSPHLLGRGLRRSHRLRLAHGLRLRQPAVSPERPRLLDGRGRRRLPARRDPHDPCGAAVGQADRVARGQGSPCWPATSSCSLPLAGCCCSGPKAAPTGRSRSRTRSSGSGSGSRAPRPPTRSRVPSPCIAPGWPPGRPTCNVTSAARSCSRSSAPCSPQGTPRPSPASIASAPNADQITANVQAQLTKSFSSAAETAEQYPEYAAQITAAAKASFLSGADWAYTAGIIAILIGALIVFLLFPRRDREVQLLADYQAEDLRTNRRPLR